MIEISFFSFSITILFILISLVIKRYFSKNRNTFVKGNQLKHIPFKFQIISNLKELSDFYEMIRINKFDYFAMDVEYYKGERYLGEICLIQITLPNNQTYIIDLIIIKKTSSVKDLLRKLLEDQKIEKIIHSCDNDLDWLYDELNISTVNVFDTQEAELFIDKNKKKPGLDHLLKKYHLCNMDKAYKKQFQQSNWKDRPLTEDQIIYAAQDSYYLIKLREILGKKMGNNINVFTTKMNEKIKNKYGKSHAERCEIKATNFFNSNYVKFNPHMYEISKAVMISLVKHFDEIARKLDKNVEKIMKLKLLYRISTQFPEDSFVLEELFKQENVTYDEPSMFKVKQIIEVVKSEKFDLLNEMEMKNLKTDNKAQSNNSNHNKKTDLNEIIKRFSCKKPVYESCQMLAPDGQLLCYCDTKKMNWYIVKKLADLITTEPPVFRLKFEPNERGCSDLNGIPSDFYVRFRKNCCVVCGKEEEYMRFHVVPLLYRQFFPNELKSHKSHDVILLCFTCMERANKLYEVNKKVISEKYKIPLYILNDKQKDLKNLQKAMVSAKHLCNHFESMPLNSKISLGKDLIDFITEENNKLKFPNFFDEIFKDSNIPNDVSSINKSTLNNIKSYKIKELTTDDKKNFHGKLVVDKIEDYQEFIRSWRNYFIEFLKPKYLPDAWNVDHQFYRTFGEYSKFKEGQTMPNKIKNTIEHEII